MATVDLTTKTLKITNNVPLEQFDCAGMHNGPYAIAEGATPYLNGALTITMYQTNVQMTIPHGDSIQLTVLTADEAAHYIKAAEQLGLTVEEVQAEETQASAGGSGEG